MLKDIDIVLEDLRIRECIKEVSETGKIDKITEYVSDILNNSSNRIFMKFDEKYVELIYKILLRNTMKFKTYIEYPCNLGFADIYVVGNKEYTKHDIMIELKYIKKSECSDNILESKREEALAELNKYIKDDRINKENLIRYIVIFSGSEVKLLESIE